MDKSTQPETDSVAEVCPDCKGQGHYTFSEKCNRPVLDVKVRGQWLIHRSVKTELAIFNNPTQHNVLCWVKLFACPPVLLGVLLYLCV